MPPRHTAQAFQQLSQTWVPVQGHHHHHHGSDSNTISQLFSELGSALQSGNLANAQQYYSTLQQDLLQFTQGGATSTSTSTSSSGTSTASGVSATA